MRKTLALTEGFQLHVKVAWCIEKNSWNITKCRRQISPLDRNSEMVHGHFQTEQCEGLLQALAQRKGRYQTLGRDFAAVQGLGQLGIVWFSFPWWYGAHSKKTGKNPKRLERKACAISLKVSKYILRMTKQRITRPGGSNKEQTW